MPWAITFHDDPAEQATSERRSSVPLHPTQLYEAGAELLILVLLLVTERKGRPFPGRTFWSYMLLYGISRFVIEFYRGDSRGMVFGDVLHVAVRLGPLVIRSQHRHVGISAPPLHSGTDVGDTTSRAA